jgi:predicted GNAT superfamily acetyltransferase
MKDVDLVIRRAVGLADYDAVVQLQKEIWGYSALEDIAAQPMLMIANRFGGCVLVAEEPSGKFIGFSFAKPGWDAGKKRLWWSHMTAVTEEYRNKDIGLRLKLRQREEALAEGIEQILWTFDPLQAMNAHFNIHKLGAIVREYEENVYGVSLSPLHRGLPTDRFLAEWHLNSDHVKERVDREPTFILRDFDRIPRINPANAEPDLRLEESLLLLEIPVNINELKKTDLALARDWQSKIRRASLHYFHLGYVVTDFIYADKPRPQALYLLEKNSAL